MPPMAAVVAAPEPEIAAKNAQAMMATMPRPPGKRPKMLLMKVQSRSDMPP